jgi:Flp pilus assembly protein TadG
MSVIKNKFKPAQSEHGQSLVEVAISLPVLILLLIGTLEFGMAIFTYSMLRDAAQEGAFYGSFNPGNTAEIENRARNISPRTTADGAVFSSPVELRDKDLVKVSVQASGDFCQGAKDGVANTIQVNVTYRYPILMPFIAQIIGSKTIPLTGTATNIILQPQCQ